MDIRIRAWKLTNVNAVHVSYSFNGCYWVAVFTAVTHPAQFAGLGFKTHDERGFPTKALLEFTHDHCYRAVWKIDETKGAEPRDAESVYKLEK